MMASTKVKGHELVEGDVVISSFRQGGAGAHHHHIRRIDDLRSGVRAVTFDGMDQARHVERNATLMVATPRPQNV